MVDFVVKLPGMTPLDAAPANPAHAGTVPKAASRRTSWVWLGVGTAALLVLAMVVGGRQVTLDKLEDFNRLAAELKPGQQVTLLIRRADATSYVTLRAAR